MRIVLLLILMICWEVTWAQTGGMATRILQKIQEDQQIQEQNASCHSESNQYFYNREKANQVFTATLNCEWQCLGKEQQDKSLIRNFSTHALGLKEGDGKLWGSLTTTLAFWGQELCLEAALSACKSLKDIDSFSLKKMKSGTWQGITQFACEGVTDIVASPFDSQVKTEEEKFGINAVPQKTRTVDWMNSENKAFNKSLKKECDQVLTGKFCIGDCVTLTDPLVETLMTPNPLSTSEFEYCADDLVKTLKNNFVKSPDLIQYYCRAFIMQQLKAEAVTGLSCAASRFDVDCSSLVTRLSSQD